MLRTTVRMLVFGSVLSTVVVLGAPSAQANAVPVARQPAVMVAATTDNPPTQDCISMVSFVLGGLAARSGAAAWTVGQGAIYANIGAALGNITNVAASNSCLS